MTQLCKIQLHHRGIASQIGWSVVFTRPIWCLTLAYCIATSCTSCSPDVSDTSQVPQLTWSSQEGRGTRPIWPIWHPSVARLKTIALHCFNKQRLQVVKPQTSQTLVARLYLYLYLFLCWSCICICICVEVVFVLYRLQIPIPARQRGGNGSPFRALEGEFFSCRA